MAEVAAQPGPPLAPTPAPPSPPPDAPHECRWSRFPRAARNASGGERLSFRVPQPVTLGDGPRHVLHHHGTPLVRQAASPSRAMESSVREYVSREEQTATFRQLKSKAGNQVRQRVC